MRSDRSIASGPLAGVDVRIKLLVSFGYVLTVVATPLGWWWFFAAETSLLLLVFVLARVSFRELVGRWLGFLSLVALMALAVAVSHPLRPEIGLASIWGTILLKNSLAFGALFTLSQITQHHILLHGLGRLGLPKPLVATLQFMYRSVFILRDEFDRMAKARRSRSFGKKSWGDWSSLAGLLGRLFLRSYERSERVHAAMLARGWDGTVRTLDGADSR